MTNWRKWFLPGVFVIAILTIAASYIQSGVVEKDLTSKALQNLEGKHPWAQVELDGRDLLLTGTKPTEEALEDAKGLINEAYDVRIITAETELLAEAKPYTFKAEKTNSKITLTGNAPSQVKREEIEQAAVKAFPDAEIDNQLVLGRGAPGTYDKMTEFVFRQVEGLGEGSASFADQEYEVSGAATGFDEFDKITKDLKRKLPRGSKIKLNAVTPPVAAPYTWSAEYDGKDVKMSGHVPSDEERRALEKKIRERNPDGRVRSNVRIAGGQISNFPEATDFATSFFSKLTSGVVKLKDGNLSVSGGARSVSEYDEAQAMIANLPEGITVVENSIQPVTADPFKWSAEKTADALTLSGFTSGESSRVAIVQQATNKLPGVSINDKMQLAGGASGEYDDATAYSVDVLAKLENGSAVWDGSDLSISGSAKSSADYEAAAEMLANSPAGFQVDGNISAPDASPYRWSISKGNAGITLRGNNTDSEAASAVVAMAQKQFEGVDLSDKQTFASGEPDGFSDAQKFVANEVAKLDAGEGSIFDNQILISGRVKDEATKTDIEDTLKSSAPAGFAATSNLLLPPPPAEPEVEEPEVVAEVEQEQSAPNASPYRWSVGKSGNGITVRGNAPDQETADAALAMVGEQFDGVEVQDKQTIASGEPKGFAAAQKFASETLVKLDAGQGSILNNQILISGRVKDEATKLEIEEALKSNLPDGFSATSNLLLPPPPPEPEPEEPEVVEEKGPPLASPYRWSVRKSATGVTVRGNAPDQGAADNTVAVVSEQLSGLQVNDKQTLASGAPDGFADAQKFITEKVDQLDAGEGSILDKQILISGRVKDEATKTAIEAALKEGTPEGYAATSNLLAPAPEPVVEEKPAPVVEEPEPTPEPPVEEPEEKPDTLALCRQEILSAIDGRQIFFDTNRASLKSESTTVLDAIVSATANCSEIKIEIAGHTDDRGNEDFNQKLSEARASTVREYLIKNGSKPELLEAKGYGETDPIADNATSAGRGKNRRIDFNIIK